jgi:hypothetical protein
MSIVRVPSNVGSITLATSGVLAPTSGLITCTALEATDLVQSFTKGAGGKGVVIANISSGAEDLAMPASVTSITINGNVYAVASGKISAVPAADAIIFTRILTYRTSYFLLVQG